MAESNSCPDYETISAMKSTIHAPQTDNTEEQDGQFSSDGVNPEMEMMVVDGLTPYPQMVVFEPVFIVNPATRSERSRQWQNPSQPEDLRKDSQYSGRFQVFETETGRSTLRITDLRETDSAQYYFKFITWGFEWRSSLPGTTLTVTGTEEYK
ncbi:hypothetical protein Q8A73_002936 [Channa argus]|nr:hypothetical protein Q8A73_002936 [Channa argus]